MKLVHQVTNRHTINLVSSEINVLVAKFKSVKDLTEPLINVISKILTKALTLPLKFIFHSNVFRSVVVLAHRHGYDLSQIYVNRGTYHKSPLVGIIRYICDNPEAGDQETAKFLMKVIYDAINRPAFCDFECDFRKVPIFSNPGFKRDCRTLFLFNNRLKNTGQPFIVKDVSTIVVKHLIRIYTRDSFEEMKNLAHTAHTLLNADDDTIQHYAFKKRMPFHRRRNNFHDVDYIWNLVLNRDDPQWFVDVKDSMHYMTIASIRAECRERGYKASAHKFPSVRRGKRDWMNFMITEMVNDPRITFNLDFLNQFNLTIRRRDTDRIEAADELKRAKRQKRDEEGM